MNIPILTSFWILLAGPITILDEIMHCVSIDTMATSTETEQWKALHEILLKDKHWLIDDQFSFSNKKMYTVPVIDDQNVLLA